MDKYEYNLKIDQIKSLCAEENYDAAVEIVDSINWSKVKNVNALVRAGEVYENVGRYDEAKEILLSAYDRSPIGRMIIYRLAELAVKMKDFDAAEEYYLEFVEIAPHDNQRYILRYDIQKAKGDGPRELIPILEELKEEEYTEEWAYELAYLYHQANDSEKCIDACDELILWFGDGPYVERALELKMLYQPLSKAQEEKYRKFRLEKQGITTIGEEEMKRAGEYVHEPVEIPQVSLNTERFNTVNLQEEIAKGMQQIIDATEKTTVSDTIDNIKKIVGDNIPYLQITANMMDTGSMVEAQELESNREIDDTLRMNFHELLGEDSDGQMSLVMNEKTMLEHQITGQMTIEEVLGEWEKTKHAAEIALQEADAQKLESAKVRALQEAGDIMDRLNDVIPKLDAGVSPKELLEEEYLQKSSTEMEGELPLAGGYKTSPDTNFMNGVNSLIDQELERINSNSSFLESQAYSEKEFEDQKLPEIEIEPENQELPKIEIEPENQELPKIEIEPENQEISEIEIEPEDQELPKIEIEPEDQELPKIEIEPENQEISEIEIEPENQELPEIVMEDDIADKLLQEATDEHHTIEPEKIANKLEKTQPIPKLRHVGKAQKLPKISIPEDLEVETSVEEKLPVQEHLTPEQKAIFSYFVPVKGMEDQLCKVLRGTGDHLNNDKTAYRGNIIIQGGRGCGKTALATSLLKVLQQENAKPNGKVGKIDAPALNKKDIGSLLRKVAGGCLIIERAGELSREAEVTLSLLLEHDDSGILVILEDTSKGIRKALSVDEGFARKFTEKVSVPIFTNDELVSFARAYAKELGYAIEEMAILALYNRISNIQRLDQATTLTEVKEIVDEAINREDHGGVKKFFSILTAARYTDDGDIVLTEKDFN